MFNEYVNVFWKNNILIGDNIIFQIFPMQNVWCYLPNVTKKREYRLILLIFKVNIIGVVMKYLNDQMNYTCLHLKIYDYWLIFIKITSQLILIKYVKWSNQCLW